MCAFTFESGSYVALVFDPPACSSQVLALQACTPYPAEICFKIPKLLTPSEPTRVTSRDGNH